MTVVCVLPPLTFVVFSCCSAVLSVHCSAVLLLAGLSCLVLRSAYILSCFLLHNIKASSMCTRRAVIFVAVQAESSRSALSHLQ